MSNEMKKFENEEFGSVRTISIDDEPWMLAKDIADILGYTNTAKAIRDHVDDEDKLTERIVLSGQTRSVVFINESGLYSLVLSSKLPSAKKFKRWVTSEVLPAIRKTGSYSTEEKLRNCNALLEERLSSIEPKAEYYDFIMNSRKLVKISDIAYEYGTTAAILNQLLCRLGIQYRSHNTWFLTEEYEGNGYVRTDLRRSYDYRRDTWREYVHTRWTQKGVEFIHRTLASAGITPVRNENDINFIQIR